MMKKSKCLLWPLLFLLCACSQIHLSKSLFVYELGSDVYANPNLFISEPASSDLELVCQDSRIVIKDNRYVIEPLDYLPVGLYDFELVLHESRVPFQIKIKDTKAPAILSQQCTFSVRAGESLIWSELLPARDISDVYYEPQSSTFFEPGKEIVTIAISDRFGNTSQREVEVEVS